MKTYKYAQGGNSGPQPPEAIANDPMFQGVRYVGKAKDHYVRKVGGQGADFRMDGEGLKFYGYNDDGLYIEDKDGNLFVAERTGRVMGDAGVKEKLRNPDLSQQERMMLLQELEESRYLDMFEYVRDAYGGEYSDEHDMTQEGASYEDHHGFAPMDTKDLLHNLDMVGSREGRSPSGEIISGPSEEERIRKAREHNKRTDYGMKTARSYMYGGNTEVPKGDPVKEMEKKIVYAMERGASDREISQMLKQSGLDRDYVFNWDNVEMRVTSFKKKDHSQFNDDIRAKGKNDLPADQFGPKDKGGQRGDMFDMGGTTEPRKLNKLMEVARGSVSPEEGRKIEQDDFFNIRTDGEGITYFIGDDGDDAYIKTPDGEYMRFQREELIEAMGDQSDMMSRRQEGQRQDGVPMGGPFAGPYGGQGASKTEDLLERLSDVGRGRKAGRGRTYAY